MNILRVKSITLIRILCVPCSFWRFLPFQACFTITVIPVKIRSQGCTLRFRPLSMRRWFVHRKSSRSAFFSVIFYDLRSLHSGTCLNTKSPCAFRWKRAFCTWISQFASFWLYFEQADRTRPRKKLGYEVNFLSTACGTVEQCTILTPFPQRHLSLIYCPHQPSRQRGETRTDGQRTKFEYSAGFVMST